MASYYVVIEKTSHNCKLEKKLLQRYSEKVLHLHLQMHLNCLLIKSEDKLEKAKPLISWKFIKSSNSSMHDWTLHDISLEVLSLFQHNFLDENWSKCLKQSNSLRSKQLNEWNHRACYHTGKCAGKLQSCTCVSKQLFHSCKRGVGISKT